MACPTGPFSCFAEFYKHYLDEHTKAITRLFHVVGTVAFVVLVIVAAVFLNPWMLLAGVAAAYGMAWVSHFFLERNRPATFRYPMWSIAGDFRMAFEILTGKLPLSGTAA